MSTRDVTGYVHQCDACTTEVCTECEDTPLGWLFLQLTPGDEFDLCPDCSRAVCDALTGRMPQKERSDGSHG